MNQQKIGSFIAACRKEQGLTQAVIAERLGITDRAVSKWETGRSLPDASLMLALCEALKINLNELFSGERLDTTAYKDRAEVNMIELKKQEERTNKRLLRLEVVIGYACSVSFLVMLFVASFAELAWYVRAALIGIGSVLFGVGAYTCLNIEHDAGYYECPNCGERYIPSRTAVYLAPHIGRSRRLKCPRCGVKAYHKKVLTKR